MSKLFIPSPILFNKVLVMVLILPMSVLIQPMSSRRLYLISRRRLSQEEYPISWLGYRTSDVNTSGRYFFG